MCKNLKNSFYRANDASIRPLYDFAEKQEVKNKKNKYRIDRFVDMVSLIACNVVLRMKCSFHFAVDFRFSDIKKLRHLYPYQSCNHDNLDKAVILSTDAMSACGSRFDVCRYGIRNIFFCYVMIVLK